MNRYAIATEHTEHTHVGNLTFTEPTGLFTNASNALAAVTWAYSIPNGQMFAARPGVLRLVAIEVPVPKKPARKSATLADVLFRDVDTVTARMLRTLAHRGSMTQADFMKLYHERCNRENPGKSSFQNNFGRFVSECWTYTTNNPRTWDTPLGCIIQALRVAGGGNLLRWSYGNTIADVCVRLSHAELTRAECAMERIVTNERDGSLAVAGDEESLSWLLAVRAEIARRSS